MSLLSNLLTFSSLNPLVQKQQRSASANSRFLFQDSLQKTTEPKQRVASKSLSKMGLMSNNIASKVDPKYRCLHRIVHSLNIKVRKNYMGFWVILQTMKKNNISYNKTKNKVDPQRIGNAVAKFSQTFEIRYLKQFENSYKQQTFNKLKNFSYKANFIKTTDKIYIKNRYRLDSHKLIRHLNQMQTLQMKLQLYQGSLQPIIKKYSINHIKQCFNQLKVCQKSIISNHPQKNDKQNQIKQQKTPQKLVEPPKQRQVSIFQIFDNLQKRVSSRAASPVKSQKSSQINENTNASKNANQPLRNTPQTQKNKSELSNHYNIEEIPLESKISNIQSETYDTDFQAENSKLLYQNHSQLRQRVSSNQYSRLTQNNSINNSKNICNSDLFHQPRNRTVNQSAQKNNPRYSINNRYSQQQQDYLQTPNHNNHNRYLSLQSSPLTESTNFRAKSPFRTCRKVLNLKQSVETDTLDSKTYQKIYKCYKISINFQEKPYQLQSRYQSKPRIMNKLTPQEFAYPEVEDLADKSNIFRDFKGKNDISIESLSISNVVAEPFMRAQTLISDIQKNRDRYDNISQRSQISYAPYLPHDNSQLSINPSRQQSNFGCDAVSFKNSLVLERQSMKKTQRQKVQMFVKKKTVINGNESQARQQLNIQKNRRKIKNQFNDRKICDQIPQTFQRNYTYNNDYLIKRQASPYQMNRMVNTPSNTVYPSYNWQAKKPSQYSSEIKNKSFSFNTNCNNSSQIMSRRTKYNTGVPQYEKKNEDFIPHNYTFASNPASNTNSTISYCRDPTAWKNQFVQNRQLPVRDRDAGMQQISKLRIKNNSSSINSMNNINGINNTIHTTSLTHSGMMMQGQSHMNKEMIQHSKKFINISKR